MSYADDHAAALVEVREAGMAVTFTLTMPGTLIPATGVYTGQTTETVAGYAVKVKGEGADRGMRGGETIEMASVRLFFVANTYGAAPSTNSFTTVDGTRYQVIDTRSIAPDGVPIATYVNLE